MSKRTLVTFGLMLAVSLSGSAVTPRFWENFTQRELLKGKLTNVSLGPDGGLFLAPQYEMFYDTEEPYIFSMVVDRAGNVYVGTGHAGKVFKLDTRGNGSLYFQSDELDIFALALDSTDALYVGTSPDGKVYKVTGADQATEFCAPGEKYIWSLVFDDKENLFVATGGRGIIYKVDTGGKKTKYYDSEDNHVVTLAFAREGHLLAGTSPGGRVLRIHEADKAFTLLDAKMEEIRTITEDRFGTIYAVGSSSKRTPASSKVSTGAMEEASPGTIPVVTIQAISSSASGNEKAGSSVAAPGGIKIPSGSQSSVFAISSDSKVETIYLSKDRMVYDALVRESGELLLSTGGKGRLLSVDNSKQVTVITDSAEEQMTCLASGKNEVWVAGSNQGKVYRLRASGSSKGSFESGLLDARTVASWGKISWSAGNPSGGTIELSTRTGNTEKPDLTWSDWSNPYTNSDGQEMTSPKARFLQWRAVFKPGPSPAGGVGSTQQNSLNGVIIPYLQQNLRPQVVGISLLPAGVALQKAPTIQTSTINVSTTANGSPLNAPRERGKDKRSVPPRRVARLGSQSVTWKATDENQDHLEFSIYFKGKGESDWKLLQEKIEDAFYTLDSAALPDGSYRLKVVASDAPSNPFGKFLIGELVSKTFVISNGTPRIDIADHQIRGKKVNLNFAASAHAGRVASAEFSIDGGEWFLIFPKDGIADSLTEEFEFSTADLTPGEHSIGLRASDGTGNTGTAKQLVRIQ